MKGIIEGINIEIVKKPIKNIYIRIYPPDGRIVVSAPQRMTEKYITEFLSSKQSWIIKQQQRIKKLEQGKPKRYETGEYHSYEGKEYLLEVRIISDHPGIILKNNRIIIMVKQGHDRNTRERMLNEWYRERLGQKLPELLVKWEKIIDVKVSELRLRRMKTKWGTCNTYERRIWLSLELAKYPDSILEYILVHEMVHLLERKHNKRFYELMDKFLPGWERRKKLISHNPD